MLADRETEANMLAGIVRHKETCWQICSETKTDLLIDKEVETDILADS